MSHHERDAEDAKLLESGDHQALWSHYLGVVLDRCRARLPAQDADDVAANVARSGPARSARRWDG